MSRAPGHRPHVEATYPGDPWPPLPGDPPEILPRPPFTRPEDQPSAPSIWVPAPDTFSSQVRDRLLEQRTVVLEGPLDGSAATFVAAQLMSLEDAASEEGDDREESEPVTLLVNSPGGPVEAVGAVLDTIDAMHSPVATRCVGRAEGTAAVVVAAGTGRRQAGMSARFRLRLADQELTGNTRQMEEAIEQARQLHGALVDRLAAVTGQERRLVARDIERGRALTAPEAVDYGLLDDLLSPS